jgi:bacterioferritin (cytochrome b1)
MTEPMDQDRRKAVEGVAMAATGLALALALGTRPAWAGGSTDVDALNALLQAELNAIDTYTTAAGVLMSPAASDPDAKIAPTVLAVAVHFQSQHKDHASALTSLIKSSGGTPISTGAAQIPTGFKASVLNVLRLAANAEKAAAIAYVQALKAITSGTAATLAAAIGGVEAEHFVVLYSLAKGLIAGTASTAPMAASLVPTSFIVQVGAETTGLDSLSDFTFS